MKLPKDVEAKVEIEKQQAIKLAKELAPICQKYNFLAGYLAICAIKENLLLIEPNLKNFDELIEASAKKTKLEMANKL